MQDLTPDKTSLEAIETASRDEISSLQLERLKWSLHLTLVRKSAYPKAVSKSCCATRASRVSFVNSCRPPECRAMILNFAPG